MIEFKDISTIYDDDFMALDGVNLEIKDGEFVSLVGPSGAGKSTLMRLLTRELKPSHGEVFVDGVNIAELSNRDTSFLRRKIGTIFQDFKLLAKMNASENVGYALEICGATREEI